MTTHVQAPDRQPMKSKTRNNDIVFFEIESPKVQPDVFECIPVNDGLTGNILSARKHIILFTRTPGPICEYGELKR